MVITILVFAFGFLVYHKMEMQPRMLKEAAIAPTAVTPSDVSEFNPVAGFISPKSQAAVTDPLVHIADLSDGSPFAESEVVLAEPGSEITSRSDAFGSSDEPAVPEPVENLAMSEVVINESPAPVSTSDAAAVIPEFSFSEPGEPESPEVAVVPETLMETEEVPLSLIPSATTSLPDIEEPRVVSQPETSFEPETNPDISFDRMNNDTRPAESAQVPEPVLLAMAEPQQSDGFATGFLPDESAVSSEAAAPDLPGFDSINPDSGKHRAESLHTENHADSRGFNAVKNPGGRKGSNVIRTAAGSGSDGKFSLAAFNYQNGVSQAAPDDGSTFDSVVVQKDDNYTKISQRVYGTVRYFAALAVFNQHRISEPKLMRPGMVVLVPDKEVLEERYPELFVDSKPKTPEIAEFLVLDDGSPAYRVGERETISEISARFLGRSSRWIEIYQLNQAIVKDPNRLKAGMILALPADAVEVSVVP